MKKKVYHGLPSADILRYLFKYDPVTGILYRRSGDPAGTPITSCAGNRSCVRVTFDEFIVPAHRVIMSMMGHDMSGPFRVDHINGDPWDNRYCNLRMCTAIQNSANVRRRKVGKKYKSKYFGVFPLNGGKYRIKIRTPKGAIQQGGYITPEDAAIQRDILAIEHKGEFASLNFPRSFYMFTTQRHFTSAFPMQ